MNGIEHISQAFASARAQQRAALMPYFTLGFPSPAMSVEVLQSIAEAGADLIELGVPFSDPLADGPTIQRSTQVAIEQGINVSRCLELVAELRLRGVSQPLLLMGYYNPILAYGVDRFVEDAAAVGVDGLIVPDLPPEEASALEAACRACHLALVYLAAPTSTAERVATLAARTTGFLYLVSLTGVTGARENLPEDLVGFIQRVRRTSSAPLAVGFGISTPEQARMVGGFADGVIVGSALVSAVARSDQPARAAADFVGELRKAL